MAPAARGPEEHQAPAAPRHPDDGATRSASLQPAAEVALRATFIIDPQGVVRYASANDLSVGRNVDEVLRVLDGLQTDELCPCNWKKGEETLTTKLKKAG